MKVYFDNIIIHSRIKEKHIKYVKTVLQKIREANLKLKLIKYKWFK